MVGRRRAFGFRLPAGRLRIAVGQQKNVSDGIKIFHLNMPHSVFECFRNRMNSQPSGWKPDSGFRFSMTHHSVSLHGGLVPVVPPFGGTVLLGSTSLRSGSWPACYISRFGKMRALNSAPISTTIDTRYSQTNRAITAASEP